MNKNEQNVRWVFKLFVSYIILYTQPSEVSDMSVGASPCGHIGHLRRPRTLSVVRVSLSYKICKICKIVQTLTTLSVSIGASGRMNKNHIILKFLY